MLVYVLMADGKSVNVFSSMESAEDALVEAKGCFIPGTVLEIQQFRVEKGGWLVKYEIVAHSEPACGLQSYIGADPNDPDGVFG